MFYTVLVIAAIALVGQCQQVRDGESQISQAYDEEFRVPDFPSSLTEVHSIFNDLWKTRLSQENHTNTLTKFGSAGPGVHIIAQVNDANFRSVLFQIEPNPLYHPRYKKITDRFLLDSMSSERVSLDDENLVSPEGVSVTTLGGKTLQIKKDTRTGLITVNAVAVEDSRQFDGTDHVTLFTLEEFLFEYRREISDAVSKDPRTSHQKKISNETREEA